MKVIVCGSTGREFLTPALDRGHTVAGYARNLDKLADLAHDNPTPVQGDVLDSPGGEAAVAGQDAVLCAIGAGAGVPARFDDRGRGPPRGS